MWIVGLLLLLLVFSGIALVLSGRVRPSQALPLWDIPRVAGTYTTIVGTLSGFTIASSIFVANIARDRIGFEDSVGIFILAFLVLIATTMQFATTPNLAGDLSRSYISDQHLSYVMANCSFYVGIALSWLGLRLLLLAINFTEFAEILTWVLFASMLMGSTRLSMHLYRHTTLAAFVCFSVPATSIGLALLYRFGLAGLWGDLWPAKNEVLSLGTFAFFVSGLAYLSQTLLLALHGNARWEALVDRYGQRWMLVFTHASVLIISLLWIAVAQADHMPG